MKDSEMMEMMEMFEGNIEFVQKNIDYIMENLHVIPILLEQVALRVGMSTVDLALDLLEQMKAVQDEFGDPEQI